MRQKILFVALSALCVFATATILQSYLPTYQYASVALSNAPAISPTPEDSPSGPVALFPLAPTKATPATPAHTGNPSEAAPAAGPVQQAPQSNSSTVDIEALNTSVREAVVNVVCQSKNSESPISASGIIIDPRGVILTNAHVAQYLLLRDSGNIALTCTVRTGSPASVSWNVRILYISSQWVHAHAEEIRETHATGTGENDYALLQITGRVSGDSLPASFPYLAPDVGSAAAFSGQETIVASYPAGFLGGVITLTNLNLVSTITKIKDVFTYKNGTHDVISLGGVILAQSGSSGGAVVSLAKRLIAVIATSSTGSQTSDRDLRGITLYHIDQSIQTETGENLESYLTGDLTTIANNFSTQIEPPLIKTLVDALMKP